MENTEDQAMDILQLQELPEQGGADVTPAMSGRTSWVSIWSDCMVYTVPPAL